MFSVNLNVTSLCASKLDAKISVSKAVSKGETVRIMTLKGEVVALAELIVDSDALQEMSNGEVAKSQSVLMDIDVYPRAWKAE